MYIIFMFSRVYAYSRYRRSKVQYFFIHNQNNMVRLSIKINYAIYFFKDDVNSTFVLIFLFSFKINIPVPGTVLQEYQVQGSIVIIINV